VPDQVFSADCSPRQNPVMDQSEWRGLETVLLPGKQVPCARSTWKNSEGEEIAIVSFRQHRRR